MAKGKEIATMDLFKGLDSGFEGTDAQTFRTPFLRILQTLSPELKKTDPKFISDAIEGQFCNSATQEIYDSINIVVLKVEHALVVWKPDRGGFVGRFDKSEESKIVDRQVGLMKWDEEGNIILDTIELYCLNIDDPSDLFIITLSTTSLKYAKTFATRLRLLKSNGKPVNVSWAGVWQLGTVEESNDKGSWFTIGNTPEFIRFITLEEKESYIMPAKEMLKTAETDYTTIDASVEEEATEF